jgi:hypothetical protein
VCARAFLEETVQKNEAMEARTVSTVVRKRSAFPYAASKKVKDVSEREVEVASARLAEAEDRARRIRWLHSYISDERGRKFHFRYEAPSMETMLEDSRRAGLSPTPDAVAQFLEPGMFSWSSQVSLCARPWEPDRVARAVTSGLKATDLHQENAAHPAVDGPEPGELPAASSGPATP